MPTVVVTTRDGRSRAVEGQADRSVMEIIRENGFDDLLALCGGCCSCATCHVYVDDAFLGALPPMADDENDLLDSLDHRSPASRLSCQIQMTQALDGLLVAIAPEE